MFAEDIGSKFQDPECLEAMANDAASHSSAARQEEEMECAERIPCDFRSLTDLSLITLKKRTYKQTGFVGVKYDGLQIFTNLTPDDDKWLRLPFGVKTDEMKTKEGKKFTTMSLRIELDDATLQAVSHLEGKLKEEALKLYPDKQWKSCLYNDIMDAALMVGDEEKNSHNNTLFMVKVPGKAPVEGSGDNFIRPLLESHGDFQNAKIKVVVVLQKMWVNDSKVGLNWAATAVMVDVPPKLKRSWPGTFKADLFKK